METKEYKHIQRWTHPQYYIGEVWPDYYSAGVGQSRDSDALERANFKAMLDSLGGEASDDETGDPLVTIVRESHWAVGWVEWIAIHESNTTALEIADNEMERLANYPVLDEELYSQIEDDDCAETWANCYDPHERLKYLRDHMGRISRRAGSNIFRLARAAVKGDWSAAANLLPCPSDILY